VSPTPGPILQTHVLTWDALGGWNGTHIVSPVQAAPWLTWAATNAADSVAIHAAGIKTVVYTHPSHQAPGMPEYSSDESTFAHDCNGNRLASLTYTAENLTDPSSAHLEQLWRNDVQSETVGFGGSFDAVFDDMADYVGNATSLPCNFDQAGWTASVNSMIANIGLPVIYNGLAAQGQDHTVSPAAGLNSTALGGMNEGCYSAAGAFAKPSRANWAGMENTEIAMAQARKIYVCAAQNADDAAISIDLRSYYEASYLLTYDPATTVLRELFSTPSGLHVFPEAKLVATNALVATPADISGLLQPSGVYGREYSDCYIGGLYAGPCAAVVNSDPTKERAFPWPGKYHRTLTLTGEGVMDGGSISIDAVAPSALVPKLGSVIAFE